MLGNIGAGELLIIGVVVLVFFGKNKLNELAHGLGKSTKEYKNLQKEFRQAVNEDYEDNNESVVKTQKEGGGDK